MKSLWLFVTALFAACAILLGAMWWSESQQAGAMARQIRRLEAQNNDLTQKIAAEKQTEQAQEAESDQLRAARAVASTRLEPTVPSASPAPGEEQARAKPQDSILNRMFKNPEMRKMIASQQAEALRGIYADFVKQAHLTPDEADHFFQLMEDRQMALMDSGANLLSGTGMDINAATAATNAANDALKSMLGSDRYAAYQQFEKTLADRMEVQQLGQQLDSVGVPLQDYQSQALVQIMSQERAGMPSLMSSASDSPGGMQQAFSMSQTDMDNYQQQLDAMNQRVYNRAMSILNPQQLTAFSAFQKSMTTQQMTGLKMAQGFFKSQ